MTAPQGTTSVVDLASLVGVLLAHELGHAIAMRLLGYTDVRIFFIPFLGAAAAGKRRGVARWKHAIVLLAGPLPGIVVGGVLVWMGVPELHKLALQLLIINGFNLLPLVPLDGGQLAQLLLFSRQRHLEIIFQGLTAAALLLFALTHELWVLAFIGYVLLLGLGHRRRVLDVAKRWRDREPPDDPASLDELGCRALYRDAWELLPPHWPKRWRGKPKRQLTTMQEILERSAHRAPSWAATACVLTVWLVGLAGAVACVYFAQFARRPRISHDSSIWRPYEHRQPDFTVIMPADAQETGFLDGRALVASPDSDHDYVVAWFEPITDPETWLATEREQLFGSSEVHEVPAPAGERWFESRPHGRRNVARLLVTHSTGVIVFASTPQQEHVDGFLDSFFLLDRSN